MHMCVCAGVETHMPTWRPQVRGFLLKAARQGYGSEGACQATALSNRGNLFQQLLLPWLALARHQLEESGRLSLRPRGRGWCRPQSLLAAGWDPSIKQ